MVPHRLRAASPMPVASLGVMFPMSLKGASEHGMIGRVVRLEGSGARVESPAGNICTGNYAVYSNCLEVVEGIIRESPQIGTKFDT